MKQYFYTDGREKFGPYTLEALKSKSLSQDTKVWFEGMSDWQPIHSIPELTAEFSSTTPPEVSQPTSQYQTNNPYGAMPPKTWLVESILVTVLCCMPFGIAGIVNASRVESRFYAGDVQGAIQASKEAGKWTKIGFWLTIIGVPVSFILYFIFIFAVLGVSSFN